MHSSTVYLLSLAIFLRSSIAKPLPNPQSFIIDPCVNRDQFPWHYSVTEQEVIAGDPQQLSDCKGPCTLAQSSEYSVGVTVEVGGSVDFSEIVGVGIETSVATTTTTGTTSEEGVDCAGPWTCSAIITPQIMHVKGDKFHNKDQGCGEDRHPYEVKFPVLEAKNPLVHLEACLCKDYDHWAEAGDLKPCPNPCTPH